MDHRGKGDSVTRLTRTNDSILLTPLMIPRFSFWCGPSESVPCSAQDCWIRGPGFKSVVSLNGQSRVHHILGKVTWWVFGRKVLQFYPCQIPFFCPKCASWYWHFKTVSWSGINYSWQVSLTVMNFFLRSSVNTHHLYIRPILITFLRFTEQFSITRCGKY